MMAKQQFVFSLTRSMVTQAVREYAAGMVGANYDLEIPDSIGPLSILATKRRAVRKAKAPKVAAVKAAA
jgi:hypothetical protein